MIKKKKPTHLCFLNFLSLFVHLIWCFSMLLTSPSPAFSVIYPSTFPNQNKVSEKVCRSVQN